MLVAAPVATATSYPPKEGRTVISFPHILLSLLLAFMLMDARVAASAMHSLEDPLSVEAVENVVEQFVEAWNSDDADLFASLFTADGQLVAPNGSVATTREEIRYELTEAHPKIFFGTMLSDAVDGTRFPAAGVAEVTGTYFLCCVEVFLGFTASSEGTFILRMTNDQGRWLIEQARIRKSG